MQNLSNTKLGALALAVAGSLAGGAVWGQHLPLAPEPAASITVAVTTQYALLNDAILKHDVDKIMSFDTDDFTEVKSNGALVDRDQERKEYQAEFGKIKSMDVRYTVDNCSETATGVCCDVHFHMTGIGFKRVLFMKIEGAFTNELVVHDSWIPTPSGPKLKSRQTLLDQTKITTE